MITFRPAQARDAAPLSELAARSEAHWGDDEAFLASFREIYRITEAFLEANEVFLAEEEGRLLGFYALTHGEAGPELEYMYLDPAQIGRGLGGLLWRHMEARCRTRGIRTVHLVCSSGPRPFYLHMGAEEIGESESLVTPGRRVTRLRYRIP